MTHADSTGRAALIGGLRALADFRESNPEVPAPGYADVFIFPPDGTCAGARAEIDVIAVLLGTTACQAGDRQHYIVTRSSGQVDYWADAICKGHDHGDEPSGE